MCPIWPLLCPIPIQYIKQYILVKTSWKLDKKKVTEVYLFSKSRDPLEARTNTLDSVLLSLFMSRNEPPHDKNNKMTVRPVKTQISLCIRPVWSESSLSAWRKLASLATHWAHSEDWSDWTDAQADLSLRWSHGHFVGFVMLRLKWLMRLLTLLADVSTELYFWNNQKWAHWTQRTRKYSLHSNAVYVHGFY